jgi:hypothetical protein
MPRSSKRAVAIALSTRDSRLRSQVTMGCGCRTSPSRQRVEILIGRMQSAPFIAALEQSRECGVVIGRPIDQRTIQLKGCDAVITAPARGDRKLAARWRERLADHFVPLGFPREHTHTYLGPADEALVVLSFTPTAACDQTPGPHAWAALP